MVDNADYTTSTPQHELDHDRSGIYLSCLPDLDHEVVIDHTDHLPELWKHATCNMQTLCYSRRETHQLTQLLHRTTPTQTVTLRPQQQGLSQARFLLLVFHTAFEKLLI